MSARESRAQRPQRVGSLVRLSRMPGPMAAAVVILLITVACLAAPYVAPYDPNKTNLLNALSPPSASHLLGTDQLGRDLLSRALHGGIPAIKYALVVLVVSFSIGLVMGMSAGYLGGWVDRAISLATDLGLAVPVLIMSIVILAVFDNNFAVAMVLLGVLMAPPIIRNIRGAVIAVRRELFVDAARVAGLGPVEIMARHLFPRIVGPVLVQAILAAGVAFGFTVGLSYLGFGPPPPDPTWGGMIKDASQTLAQSSWPMIVSGGILAIMVFCLMVLGEGLREASVAPWTTTEASLALSLRPVRRAKAAATTVHSTEPPKLLEVENLELGFKIGPRELVVVENVSFAIESGQAVGLLGESGCGKSTVARAIAQIMPSTGRILGGNVRFKGVDTESFSVEEHRKFRGDAVGFVFQDPMATLEPTMRVGCLLAEVVRTHRRISRAEAEHAALDLLRRVRIPEPEKIARRYPHELSGGLAQRVAIARAIANEPELLIADEPTTALDATIQLQILDLLKTLQKETGVALLIVTHDWDVVSYLCDEAIVMYGGQIAEKADVPTLMTESVHPYTRALLRCRPGIATDRSQPLTSIPGTVASPFDWKKGCRFADRCPERQPACSECDVPLVSDGAGHFSRCLFSDFDARGMTAVKAEGTNAK